MNLVVVARDYHRFRVHYNTPMLCLLPTLRPAIRFRTINRLFSRNAKVKGEKYVTKDSQYAAQRSATAEKVNKFVAKWQSEGDRYVSYDNLVKLDGMLSQFTTDRSINEKADLLSELTLTYFAR